METTQSFHGFSSSMRQKSWRGSFVFSTYAFPYDMRESVTVLLLFVGLESSVADSQLLPSALFVDSFARQFSRNAITILLTPGVTPMTVEMVKNLR